MQGYTKQAIAARIGASASLGDAATAANTYFAIPFNFGSVADNASSTKSRRVSRAGALVVTAITGVLYTGSGTAVTFSEAVTLEAWTNGNGWQEEAIPWDAWVGTGVQPFVFPFQPVIPDGADLSWKLNNAGSGATVVGSIVLHCVVSRR